MDYILRKRNYSRLTVWAAWLSFFRQATSHTMPTFAIGETVAICDSTGEHIGDFRIYDSRIGAWLGTFCPMPAYDRVRHLFAKHAELVTTPGLSFIDEAKEKIAALGLWARIGSDRLEIRDVQIYEGADGIGGSFRQVA